MYAVLVILMCIVAILMILIVLMQESKGGGLSSSFSSYNQIAGVRKTTDFVEKLTWTFAGLLVVISIACAYVAPKATNEASVMDGVEVNTTTNIQNFGASQTGDVITDTPENQ